MSGCGRSGFAKGGVRVLPSRPDHAFTSLTCALAFSVLCAAFATSAVAQPTRATKSDMLRPFFAAAARAAPKQDPLRPPSLRAAIAQRPVRVLKQHMLTLPPRAHTAATVRPRPRPARLAALTIEPASIRLPSHRVIIKPRQRPRLILRQSTQSRTVAARLDDDGPTRLVRGLANLWRNRNAGTPDAAARKKPRHAGRRFTRVGEYRIHVSRAAGVAACKAAARQHGVPIRTALAVCLIESSFRCDAVGGVGELGLLQIKYETARLLGYRGPRDALKRCDTGAYWGMKHLAMAIRRGGVWKHNQGIWAKRPSAMARVYAAKVLRASRRF